MDQNNGEDQGKKADKDLDEETGSVTGSNEELVAKSGARNMAPARSHTKRNVRGNRETNKGSGASNRAHKT